MFCPVGVLGVAGSDDDAASVGFADATHGVAATAAPMPRATAKAPIRPTCFAYPIFDLPLVENATTSRKPTAFVNGLAAKRRKVE
jgi:hypothetical protein